MRKHPYGIDRNPQTSIPNIYAAKAGDLVRATLKVYAAPDTPSRIALAVVRR